MKKIASELKCMFIPHEENKYRPEFLAGRALFWLVAGFLVLKILIIPFYVYFPDTFFFADITRSTLINLANNERQSLGIDSLQESAKLNSAAYLKAKDMIDKDYFSHQSPEGFSPWYWFKRAGYNYRYAGENLAIGFLDSEEVHVAWLNSYSHKKNILNSNYDEIGIAVLKGEFQGRETTVVVQHFGFSGSPTVSYVEPLKEKPLAAEIVRDIDTESTAGANVVSIPLEVAPFAKETYTSKLFKFFSSDYDNLVEDIVFGLIILVVISLVINVLVESKIQHRDLIFRTLIIIAILSFSFFVDKQAMIDFIPHNLII